MASGDVSPLTDYCHESTYKFAFSVLILGYILLALMMVLTVCGCCVASCCACALAAGTLAGGIAGGLTGGLMAHGGGKGGCGDLSCTDEEEEPTKKLEAIEVA